MYLVIGKKECVQCKVLQNMLFEKKLPHHYVDEDELNQATMLYLKGYFPTSPMVLQARPFEDFPRMLTYFRGL